LIKGVLNEFEQRDLFFNEEISLRLIIKNSYIISETSHEYKRSVDSKAVYINQKKWSTLDFNLDLENFGDGNEETKSKEECFGNVEFHGEHVELDGAKYLSDIKKCVTKGKRVLVEHAIILLVFIKESRLHIQAQMMCSGTKLNIMSLAQGRMICTNSFGELCKRLQNEPNYPYKSKGLEKGEYNSLNLMFENEAASILVHEVAHIFEKDGLREMVGHKIMNDNITIVDSPFVEGSWSNRIYDDFGRRIDDCVIVKAGVLMNAGNMISRDLINDNDRKRFMINTMLLNSEGNNELISEESFNKGMVFSQILGAKNDGKHIILSRCTYRNYNGGNYSEEYYVNKVVLKIADIVKKMIPVGNNNCLVNGICSNKYYVSYSAPTILIKEMAMEVI